METSLRLLMRDGALCVRFHPRLTPEQYGELDGECKDASTTTELRARLLGLAKRWGIEADVSDSI